jgi:hypothetical protein
LPYFCWFPLSLLGGTSSAFQPESAANGLFVAEVVIA